ncbi:MAG TPA: hypothetical protein VMO88_17210 [Acidimicrobiales bacterium]|nr:hypothetical protein [Acidimicrobiales bacterium]
MNITLWIIAGLLAVAYFTVGMMKIVRPYESIVANRNMAWAKDVAPAGVKVVGGIEIIGPGQRHQTGAQATAASIRSVLVTEPSLSQALMAPANP